MTYSRALTTAGFTLLSLLAATTRASATTPAAAPEAYPTYTPPPGATPPPPPPGTAPAYYPPPPPGTVPYYPPPPPPPGVPVRPPVTPEKHIGVGYKIGNGLGFTGADLIIAPIGHVALDLQANYVSVDVSDGFTTRTATGYGLAPSLQGRLYEGQVNTPYLGVGFLRVSLSLDSVTASGNGYFVNGGYEWRWDSGLGVLLGAGVAHINSVHATDGVTTINDAGFTRFNLEVGLRFMFL
jgi:hypothetical protein